MVALTRAQMRLFQDLRENEQAFVDNIRRGTRDALTNAGLAYETSSGAICLSEDGRRAVICHGRQVLVPKGVSESATEIPGTDPHESPDACDTGVCICGPADHCSVCRASKAESHRKGNDHG